MYVFLPYSLQIKSSALILCVKLVQAHPITTSASSPCNNTSPCDDPSAAELKRILKRYIAQYNASVNDTTEPDDDVWAPEPTLDDTDIVTCESLPDEAEEHITKRSTCPGVYKVSHGNSDILKPSQPLHMETIKP